MSTQDFIETINKLRLSNKDKWYTWSGFVNGKHVAIHGYNTWMKIFTVDGVYIPCPMDISVKKYKEVLHSPFINY